MNGNVYYRYALGLFQSREDIIQTMHEEAIRQGKPPTPAVLSALILSLIPDL